MEEQALDLPAYLNLLDRDLGERDLFFNSITINETYFFREEKQFKALRDFFIPRWNERGGEPLRLWSASCSSGEEPLSLYALLKEFSRRPFTLTASDISGRMLEVFSRGSYRYTAFRHDGEEFRDLLDRAIKDREEKSFSVEGAVLEEIDRKQINVFSDSFDGLPDMDLIFFRNTLIYMSPDNKKKIIGRLAGKLKEEGVLFLSVSETALISDPALELEEWHGVYFFRKKAPLKVAEKTAPVPASSARGSVSLETAVRHRLPEDDLELCRRINRYRGRGKICPPEDSGLVCQYVNLAAAVENQDLEEASEFLGKDRELSRFPGLFHFFSGYLAYSKGCNEEAAAHFRSSVEACPKLWPSRYYLLRSGGRELNKEEKLENLEAALEQIRRYISADRYDFQFLLEGFNARYFELICNREREQLASGSV
nr:CheR family methyltransferase [Spirochaeta isovalerica]